jgi:hypothetical protein
MERMMKTTLIDQPEINRRDAMKGGIGAASLAAVAGMLPPLVTPTLSFAQDGQEPLGGQPPKEQRVQSKTLIIRLNTSGRSRLCSGTCQRLRSIRSAGPRSPLSA